MYKMNLITIVCLITLVALVVFPTGCSPEVSNLSVRTSFPKAKVEIVPGSSYEWIVQEGSNIYYVYYCGGNGVVNLRKYAIPLFESDPAIK
jgi:hypothetical protein